MTPAQSRSYDLLWLSLALLVLLPPARLSQLLQDLEAAICSQPTTLTALRQCLVQLSTSAAAVVAGVEALDANPGRQLRWWAHAFAMQCRDALDELAFLAPWTERLATSNRLAEVPGLDEIPTLRELAALDEKRLPAIELQLSAVPQAEESARLGELQRLSTEASLRARTRIAAIKGFALLSDAFARMEYIRVTHCKSLKDTGFI